MLAARSGGVNTGPPRGRPGPRGGPRSARRCRTAATTAATVSRWRGDLAGRDAPAAAREAQGHRELVGQVRDPRRALLVQELQQRPRGPVAQRSARSPRSPRKPKAARPPRTPPPGRGTSPGRPRGRPPPRPAASSRRASQSRACAASRCRARHVALEPAEPRTCRGPPRARPASPGRGRARPRPGLHLGADLAAARRIEARAHQLEARLRGRGAHDRRPVARQVVEGRARGTWVPPVTSTRLGSPAGGQRGSTVCSTSVAAPAVAISKRNSPARDRPGLEAQVGRAVEGPARRAPQTRAAARTAARCWGRRPGTGRRARIRVISNPWPVTADRAERRAQDLAAALALAPSMGISRRTGAPCRRRRGRARSGPCRAPRAICVSRRCSGTK